MWCDVMWCDVIWYDVVWCDVMWCHVMSCHVMWCDIMWFNMMWYETINEWMMVRGFWKKLEKIEKLFWLVIGWLISFKSTSQSACIPIQPYLPIHWATDLSFYLILKCPSILSVILFYLSSFLIPLLLTLHHSLPFLLKLLEDPSNFFVVDLATTMSESAGVPKIVQVGHHGYYYLALPPWW